MSGVLRTILLVLGVFATSVALCDNCPNRPPESGQVAWAKYGLEWLYLVVPIFLAIVGWFKRNNMICWMWKIYDAFVKYTIQDLEKKHLSIEHLMDLLRARVPVAIIDDNSTASRGMKDLLDRSLGFKSVSEIYPPEFSNKQLEDMLLFVVDIKGVAFTNLDGSLSKHQGLDVAKAIKQRFPLARVISYSADIDAFSGCDILNDVIDERFEKRDNADVKLRKLDTVVKQLFDPVLFWEWYRKSLSGEKVSTMEIVGMENKFVRSLIHVNELSLDSICLALKNLDDPKRIAKTLVRIVGTWEEARQR